jgi:hypothetical protein
MKHFERITRHRVFKDWRNLENCPAHEPLRPDILDGTFPASTQWFTAEVEAKDIDVMYLLPVRDFGPLSRHTWQLPAAAAYFEETFPVGAYDPTNPHNATKMTSLLAWPAWRSTRAIIVSDIKSGPFTILDGNHRAILLKHQKVLVGASVYVGVAPAMRDFSWARRAFAMHPALQ